jgi:heme/copper-type cytochrome/quinol oxidase subunit 2
MWNPWIVATLVAIVGASAVAWFSRRWLIGAIAVGIGTPFALVIGDEIVSGRHNKFIILVIVLASFLTVPAALIAAYSIFRFRHSGDGQDGRPHETERGD